MALGATGGSHPAIFSTSFPRLLPAFPLLPTLLLVPGQLQATSRRQKTLWRRQHNALTLRRGCAPLRRPWT